MIIQKAGVLRYLRYLGIFCVIAMGFFSIVATSEDDAADALGIPSSADTDLALQSVTVEKGTGGLSVNPFASTTNCGATTIQTELDNSGLSQDLLDLASSIEFTQLDIDYTYSVDGALEDLSCTLTIEYNAADVEIGTVTIDTADKSLVSLVNVTVPTTAMEAINYYLAKANWSVPLNYCVVCTDTDTVQNYTLTYSPTFKVKVSR